MDGKGRALDNIFIERLWRSVKYEEVYLTEYVTPRDARISLGRYLAHYNQERPHSGKYCYGKTPMQTFLESKHLAKEKELDNQKWWAFDSTNRTPTTVGNNLTVR